MTISDKTIDQVFEDAGHQASPCGGKDWDAFESYLKLEFTQREAALQEQINELQKELLLFKDARFAMEISRDHARDQRDAARYREISLKTRVAELEDALKKEQTT